MTVTSGEEEPLEVATRSSRIGKRRERNDESESSGEEIESKRRKESNSRFATRGWVRFELSLEGSESSGQWQEESSIEKEEKEGESDGYIDDSTEEDGSVESVEKGEEDGVEEGEEDGVGATEESGGEEECGETRYCPPHIRGREKSLQRRPAVERLQRTLQGLVNRYLSIRPVMICVLLSISIG